MRTPYNNNMQKPPGLPGVVGMPDLATMFKAPIGSQSPMGQAPSIGQLPDIGLGAAPQQGQLPPIAPTPGTEVPNLYSKLMNTIWKGNPTDPMPQKKPAWMDLVNWN